MRTIVSLRHSASTRAAMLALAGAAVAAGSLAGAASADPGGITGTMFNCTGPAETPTVIVWEKQSLSGGGLHIVGTNETFNRQGGSTSRSVSCSSHHLLAL